MEALALTENEQAELVAFESVIERGLKTFIEVGQALLAIRDARLYRATHPTFEEYCGERWGLKQTRAYQLMDTAGVMDNLKSSTMVELLPSNERQARPLITLPTPELQRAAWTEAVQTAPNGKLTAAHVEAVAERYKPAAVRSFDPDDSTPEPFDDYDAPESRESEDMPEPAEPPRKSMEVHYRSESKEWYTPEDFLSCVRALLGTIDLDPASSAAANRTVQARRYFDEATNGLSQSWDAANIYLNPPYGDQIRPFVEKALAEYRIRAFAEGLLLVPARTDTEWFGLLREFPRCFITGRMRFWNPSNPVLTSAPFPSVVFYLGERGLEFGRVFSAIGDVYALWSPS